MRNFTWKRFPIKNLLIDSLLTPSVESTYLNRYMCKFESSQKDESRWQSTDSSKAYRNTSAFKCSYQGFAPNINLQLLTRYDHFAVLICVSLGLLRCAPDSICSSLCKSFVAWPILKWTTAWPWPWFERCAYTSTEANALTINLRVKRLASNTLNLLKANYPYYQLVYNFPAVINHFLNNFQHLVSH